MDYNCGGWATKYNTLCADGLTIMPGAFAQNDGVQVPLVWNHGHDSVSNVLGHCVLADKPEGVYAYCVFNETEQGQNANALVHGGDIEALSIWANQLTKTTDGRKVAKGNIREVSLVLGGCNPGAGIDHIMHSDTSGADNDCLIYNNEYYNFKLDGAMDDTIDHSMKADDKEGGKIKMPETTTEKDKKEPEKPDDKTVGDILEAMTDEQKAVVNYLLGTVAEAYEEDGANKKNKNEKGADDTMKHNVFDSETGKDELKHSMDDINAAVNDGKVSGTMKNSFLAHGITNIDYLIPEAQTMNEAPGFVSREMGWVSTFMGKVHKTPFSRIKSIFANLTADDARAKGYIKGKQKVNEVFTLLKRTTTPTTVYKKQQFDRDDIIDISNFDVIAWVKNEMRMMLDEEIARAVIVGDGRISASDDKINELNIRPIWTDDDLYTIKATFNVTGATTADARAKEFIRTCIKARKDYKGSGNPTLWAPSDIISDCLLLEDTTGRRIYNSITDLSTALNVISIVDVPVMEGLSREVDGKTHTLLAIIVNPADYNLGADKGGAVNMFDDFDIDFNAYKYLIETRCSGAMVTPYGAIAVETVLEGV